MITVEKLTLVVPFEIAFEILGTLERFSINTPLRASHFISQCKHESANFFLTTENLNYSAIGLMNVFSQYFPSLDTATAYARQPEKIANRVYASRMGNGDEKSGDGFRFRGRGYIQLTGKNNYTAFSKAIDEDIVICQPDTVAIGKYRALSAGWFWDVNKLNTIADKGSDEKVIQEITKKINGGYAHLAERIKYFNAIYSQLK